MQEKPHKNISDLQSKILQDKSDFFFRGGYSTITVYLLTDPLNYKTVITKQNLFLLLLFVIAFFAINFTL